ncbi:MAG: DUF1638 domain-containing protein [Planctomycetaceae bacterium]|jgi:hypothetical protein|nr:DUF1638 domain-containing protein [Planctomycetaceae bacterium]
MNGEIDWKDGKKRRFKLLACEILFREICSLVAVAHNRIDVEFLPKGLHDIGRQGMFSRLSEKFSTVDETEYDAILLGYALCSGGIVGLSAKTIPIVVPRAHDCITLFLGNRQRYHDYFFANSGTYFKTTGWIERGADLGQGIPDEVAEKLGLGMSFQKMVERYGEDNACYLRDQLSQMRFYTKLAFIETGIEPDDFFEQHTIKLAKERQWEFEKLHGDLTLLRRLLNGAWDDEDFLIVPPGHQIEFSYDDNIIQLGTAKNTFS